MENNMNIDRFKFRVWSTYKGGLPPSQKKYGGKMIYLTPPKGSIEDLESNKNWHVMQSTGLKDKNGVLIYEGDILSVLLIDEDDGTEEWEDCNYSYVLFKDAMFGVVLNNNIEDFESMVPFNEWDSNSVKIIGNIYQNPELLTNTK